MARIDGPDDLIHRLNGVAREVDDFFQVGAHLVALAKSLLAR